MDLYQRGYQCGFQRERLSESQIAAGRSALTAMLNRLSAGERTPAPHRIDWEPFLIRHISGALARIRDGSYGFCLRCGQAISPERLAALPWAAVCVSCQEATADDEHK